MPAYYGNGDVLEYTPSTSDTMGGDVLIQNAAMVLPSGIVEGDLRVKSGIIQTIAPNGGLDHHTGELIIDATGLYLCLLYTSDAADE